MRILLAAAALSLALAAPVLGSGRAKVTTCSGSVLNLSGRTLELKRASSYPAWAPGARPQPAPVIDDHAAAYWSTFARGRGCWNHVVYRSGRRVVEVTVEGRSGHAILARCRQRGFHRCRIITRVVRPPRLLLSVRLS